MKPNHAYVTRDDRETVKKKASPSSSSPTKTRLKRLSSKSFSKEAECMHLISCITCHLFLHLTKRMSLKMYIFTLYAVCFPYSKILRKTFFSKEMAFLTFLSDRTVDGYEYLSREMHSRLTKHEANSRESLPVFLYFLG